MITSGIIKLAKVMHVPKSRKVFRGVAGMVLPECFFKANKMGFRGAAEPAFMSTSLNKDVTMKYVAALQMALVFELAVGEVNRGAEVSWCSQYPLEDEVLFPPLSHLEVMEDPKIMQLGSEGEEVLVFSCHLSVNLRSLSREELEARRHTTLISSMTHQLQQIERDLHCLMQAFRADASTTQGQIDEGDTIVQMLVEECRLLIDSHRNNPARLYNENEHFHQLSLQEATMLPRHAMAKFGAWKDRAMCRPSNFHELTMQEWSAFFEGELWKTFSEVLSIVPLYTKCTRTLTFENNRQAQI